MCRTRTTSAVCFLWHFPSPRGARPLAGIPLYGARTFLYALLPAQRPPSRLPAGKLITHGEPWAAETAQRVLTGVSRMPSFRDGHEPPRTSSANNPGGNPTS